MDRYQRVEKPRAETTIDENEIRITSQGRMRSYITYAMSLLQEKGSTEIVFKAMGRAINKTVTIVELIKRRIVGLHQITSIGSTDITDTWEPLEEGLLPLETTRHVSMITITLSNKELNTSSVGYQPPLPADQVKAWTEFDYEGGSATLTFVHLFSEGSPTGRGRGRGGRGRGRPRTTYGNGFAAAEYEDGGWDRNRGYARGRSRGRGRNFRGRGRGGYSGPRVDAQQDAEGYNQEGPARGYNQEGPARGYNQDGPARGYNQDGPARGYNQDGPARGYNRDGLARGYNRDGPARGYNQDGPARGYDQDGHAQGRNYNQDGPAQGRGVVAVGGDTVGGAVALDPMDQSMQLLESLNWVSFGHNAGFLLYHVFGCLLHIS
ncbi:unnamed protein product [Camellia sinensis]